MNQPEASRSSPVALLLFAVAILLYLYTPIAIGRDGEIRFRMLTVLLRDGTLDSTKYSLAGPVAASPFWFLGNAIGQPERVTWWFNRVVTVVGVAGLWWVLRDRLSRSERRAFALLLLFGSMFPWNAMTFSSEPFTAVALALGLAMLATGRAPAAGGVLAVWGTANIPASAVGLALASCVLCWHHRRVRYLLLPACAAAVILLENWARRGHPLANGYEGEAGFHTVLPYSALPGFSYPLFFGLLSILFSFGKGLVFFTPGLFARYPTNTRLTRFASQTTLSPQSRGEGNSEADLRLVYRVWLAVVVGLVLVYARWWSWYGGLAWGPRFFLFACIPASLVLARWTSRAEANSTWANLLALAALTLSCWVGANGAVYREFGQEQFWANNFELEYLMWYVPECSVLWRPFVVLMPLSWADYARLAAFASAFAYLAWPVARVLGVRTRAGVGDVWSAVRSGPRWRV